MYNFGDLKDYCAKYVGEGKCPDDPLVESTLNEASELLMQEANWNMTLAKLMVKTYNQCLTLPENIEAVLKVDFYTTPAHVFSQAYEFLDGGPGLLYDGNNTAYRDLVDEGDGYPTFFPVGNTERKLIALSTESEDQGLEIRVRGKNEANMEVEPTTPGEMLRVMRWKNGEEGIIDANNLDSYLSDNSFLDITSITKPVTSGYVTLYSYDPTTKNIWLLGKYHPKETIPGYRRYRITASSMSDCETVTMLVKLKHVPFRHDSDIAPIQQLTAYKYMCKHLHQSDNGDPEAAEVFLAKAIRILNKKYENSHPPTMDFDVNVDEALTNDVTNLYGV